MSEHLHPGLHPDADSLNAFIEGVLPEHERLACLAHLADCSRCREIVYLAQEPVAPAPIPAETPFRSGNDGSHRSPFSPPPWFVFFWFRLASTV